jgi:plasmid replication initiation protein
LPVLAVHFVVILRSSFYHPITNLTVYQRGLHYMGIRIFNNLPPYIKDISNNVKKFENCLKRFLHIHSFYSLEEYFQHNSTHYKCWHSYLTSFVCL